jgi:hypothetical protein
MTGSWLLYGGALLALAGLLLLGKRFRRSDVARRTGWVAILAGLGMIASGLALPEPLRRSARTPARIDEFVIAYQFSEHHTRRIQAPADTVMAAVRSVTAREIKLFRTLTAIRNPAWPWRRQPESILAPPPDRPILETATRGGFVVLADTPREAVLGTLVIHPPGAAAQLEPQQFAILEKAGYAKAVINFLVADEGGGFTRLSTETRVYATDPWTARRFAVYWRLIYPGSALLRRNWLAAIERRAEGGSGGP